MDVLGDKLWIFLALVFVAVFLLSQGMVIPVFGESRGARKRLSQRMKNLTMKDGSEERISLMREHYLKDLSPLEKRLETLSLLQPLVTLVAQSGYRTRAYRVLLLAMLLEVACGFAGYSISGAWWAPLVVAPLGALIPFMYLRKKRSERIAKIEEQLPDVVDVIIRALRAGHPFIEAIRLVSTEMPSPVKEEFQTTFNEINYGGDVRSALFGLLQRVPSVLIMALITAVLVQRESGGNLAEVLEKIASVWSFPFPEACPDPVSRGPDFCMGSHDDSVCPVCADYAGESGLHADAYRELAGGRYRSPCSGTDRHRGFLDQENS